eukprot:1394232-Amorphochlora_amoeboformis.AAC.2
MPSFTAIERSFTVGIRDVLLRHINETARWSEVRSWVHSRADYDLDNGFVPSIAQFTTITTQIVQRNAGAIA